jgi:hypothetical protein
MALLASAIVGEEVRRVVEESTDLLEVVAPVLSPCLPPVLGDEEDEEEGEAVPLPEAVGVEVLDDDTVAVSVPVPIADDPVPVLTGGDGAKVGTGTEPSLFSSYFSPLLLFPPPLSPPLPLPACPITPPIKHIKARTCKIAFGFMLSLSLAGPKVLPRNLYSTLTLLF